MSKLSEYLNRQVIGNVFDNPNVLKDYIHDRSIMEIEPQLVAFPDTPGDIQKLLRFLHQLALRDLVIPVTPRGTGRDKTGAALGSGLILSLERLNQLEELDARGRLVRVQPGLTLGELNRLLALHNLWLPIGYDPRVTIGGLIANNPTDSYYSRYGGIVQAVEQVEMVLPSGDLILLSPYSRHQVSSKIAEQTTEGKLYQRLERLFDDQADTILDRSMQALDAVGYPGATRVHDGHSTNLLPLLFGSQGTLGVITDIILHVELRPSHPRRLLASFHDLAAAERFLAFATEQEPYELELYDLGILEAATGSGKRSRIFPYKFGKGVLVLVGFDQKVSAGHRLRTCLDALPENALRIAETPENAEEFQAIHNLILAYLNETLDSERTPVLDDLYIPATGFRDFLAGLHSVEQALDQPLYVFGSYTSSSYNIRPNIDLASLAGRQALTQFIKLVSDLVGSCGGSITGHTPEGRVKALVPTKSLGVGERQVYAGIKEAFDPLGMMNPGVKLGADTRDTLTHLRSLPLSGVATR